MPPSDLTVDLPAPRDDEPASLRDDIADELRDHLECALRREQLRTSESTTNSEPRGLSPWPDTNNASIAHQRVLQRFGDPRSVARKLWFDAMWERIMGQRLLTGLTCVAVLACCVMAALMWQMQNAQRDMLRESQAQNAKLMEQFQAAIAQLKPAAVSEAPSEWNPLTVNCTFDTDGNPAAAGVKVVLESESDNTAGIPTSTQTSGADGAIDFGKVLYGQYALHYTAPNGMQRTENISVMPGQAKEVTVVCPSGEGLTQTTPKIVADPSSPPPAALADQLWYFVRLQRRNTQPSIWQRPHDDQYIDWLIGPQGKAKDVSELYDMRVRHYDNTGARGLSRSTLPPGPLNEFIWSDFLTLKAPETGSLPAEPGTYIVVAITPCLVHPDTSEGMRLLLLTPPLRLEETNFGPRGGGFGQGGGNLNESPTFMVIYDKPATVDIPLTNVRFDYMDRVLKAAPGHVAWRFTGSSLPSFRLSWGSRSQYGPEPRARIGLSPEESSLVSLTGIEVIGWERIDPDGSEFGRSPGSLRRGGPRRYEVAAVLLVTPEEREVLQKHQAKLGIAMDPEDTPRSQLTPEMVQALEAAQSPAEARTDADESPKQEGERSPATP